MSTDADFQPTAPLGHMDQGIDLPAAVDELISDLAGLLLNPFRSTHFLVRLDHLVDRMGRMLKFDTDGLLFLLFQNAQYELSNYSAAHALRCAVLCHLCAAELRMRSSEAGCLVGAALTMNISMTSLQNELALQIEPPSPEQQRAIRSHAVRSRLQLSSLGISNELWLDTVATHHEIVNPLHGAAMEQPSIYLPRLLGLIDRFAARLTPRNSRQARAAMEFGVAAHGPNSSGYDAAVAALVKALGVCPPGTYVKLINGEIAVVVKQGARANQPLVASVIPSASGGKSRVRLMDCAEPEFWVNGSTLASELDIVRPDYRKLVQLLPKS